MQKARRDNRPRSGALATGVGASVLLAAFALVVFPAVAEEAGGKEEASPLAKAEAFEAKKKWKKAEEEYQKTLEAAPEKKEPYEALVGFYERRKRLDDGVAYFDAMLAAHPDRLACHLALMKLYRMKKMPDKAREHFLAVLAAADPEFLGLLKEKEASPPRRPEDEDPEEGKNP